MNDPSSTYERSHNQYIMERNDEEYYEWRRNCLVVPEIESRLRLQMFRAVEEHNISLTVLHVGMTYLDKWYVKTSMKLGAPADPSGYIMHCLYLACKFDETMGSIPSARELDVNMDTILSKESDLELALDSNYNIPTVWTFLEFLIPVGVDGRSSREKFVAFCSYLSEVTLITYSNSRFSPLMIASGIIYVARSTILELEGWTQELSEVTGNAEPAVKKFIYLFQDSMKLRVDEPFLHVKSKYDAPDKYRVASITIPEL